MRQKRLARLEEALAAAAVDAPCIECGRHPSSVDVERIPGPPLVRCPTCAETRTLVRVRRVIVSPRRDGEEAA